MKKKNGATSGKTFIIIVLILIILLLGSYIILNKSSRTSSFLADYVLLQNKLSYYVGSLNAETFNAYDDISLLTSYSNGDMITDFGEETLVALADKDSRIDSDNVSYYMLNKELIKDKFNIDLSQYTSINFYVSEGVNIKVKVDELPKWWNENFDLLTF